MQRREFITLLGGAATAWPFLAEAQNTERVRRIGVLIPFSEADAETQTLLAAFKQCFQELGWIEGRNVLVESRFTDGNPERTRGAGVELCNRDYRQLRWWPDDPAALTALQNKSWSRSGEGTGGNG